MLGYLGELSYFVDGYQRDLAGKPVGQKEKAEVISYVTDATGNPFEDAYGKQYPKVLRFKLIEQAKKMVWYHCKFLFLLWILFQKVQASKRSLCSWIGKASQQTRAR